MAGNEELLDQWFPQSDPVLQQLRMQVQMVSLDAGETVFRCGDPCRNYLIVLEGSVRVQVLSAGGREVVLYRVLGGQSCVITTSCLISHESYPAEGVTDVSTLAMVIPQGLFNEALGVSEPFRRFVFANQGMRLSDLIQRIEDVAFGRVDSRLARLLVDRSNGQTARVQATHQQLASELGTAREVISRQIKAFEKNGWVAARRGAVEVLDRDALTHVWKSTDSGH